MEPDSNEYYACSESLKNLYTSKKVNNSNEDKVDKKTIVLCATNLIGIGLVCFKEQIGVLTSKGLSMIQRLRNE